MNLIVWKYILHKLDKHIWCIQSLFLYQHTNQLKKRMHCTKHTLYLTSELCHPRLVGTILGAIWMHGVCCCYALKHLKMPLMLMWLSKRTGQSLDHPHPLRTEGHLRASNLSGVCSSLLLNTYKHEGHLEWNQLHPTVGIETLYFFTMSGLAKTSDVVSACCHNI